MSTSLTGRLAATSTVVALGIGGGAIGATTADAAAASVSYTCATVIGPQTVPVKIKFALPASVKSGAKVKARPVSATMTLPSQLVFALNSQGITSASGTITGMRYRVGSKLVPIKKVKLKSTPVPASGAMTTKFTGIAGGFTAGAPGTYVLKVPSNFAFNGKDQNGTVLPGSPIYCGLTSGSKTKLGSLKVTKH